MTIFIEQIYVKWIAKRRESEFERKEVFGEFKIALRAAECLDRLCARHPWNLH